MIKPVIAFYPHWPKTSWFSRLFSKLLSLFRKKKDTKRAGQFIGGLILFQGKILSCSEDHTIRITSLEGKTKVIAKFDLPVNYISLNADQSLMLACSDDGKVYVYETGSFKKIKVLEGLDQSGVRKAEFTAKGNVVAAANSGQAAVWNMQTGAVQIFSEHKVTVDAIIVHPKKEIAITNDMTGLTLAWNLETLKVIRRVTEPKGKFIKGIFHYGANACCSNGQYMAFGAEEIEVFDYDFNLVHTIKGLPYSPQGMTICNGTLWAGSHYLKGWKLDSWKEVFSQDMRPPVFSMIPVPHRNLIITGHEYGLVYVWDTADMIQDEVAIAHMSFVNCVISDDEHMVTSGEDDKSIIVWDKNSNATGRYFGAERMIGLCGFLSADEILFVDESCAQVLNIKTLQVIRKVTLSNYFRFKDCIRNNDELFLLGALEYPGILNLATFELKEIPYKTSFTQFSNRLGDEIAVCGYARVPNGMKDSFKPRNENEELLEAPVVILNLASGTITKEFWFNPAYPFGVKTDGKEEVYPVSAFLEPDFITAGYNDGSIVKWDRHNGKYKVSAYKSEEGMEGIYVTPKGNIVVATFPAHQLVVLNRNLEIEKMLEFKTSVWARFYDAEKNTVIVADTVTQEVLFFNADTLELTRRERFKDPRKIYKFAEQYYMFSSREWSHFGV